MLRNTQEHYGSVSKLFHWLMFLLILGMLIVGLSLDSIDDKALRSIVIGLHKSTGLLVLTLVCLRALWALMNPKPGSAPGTSPMEHVAERGGHLALYFLMFAMPITGWVMSTAAGYIPDFYGLFSVAAPGIAKNKPLSELFGQAHEILAWTIIVVVSGHIAAAMYHHYIRKDNILRRMIPGSKI